MYNSRASAGTASSSTVTSLLPSGPPPLDPLRLKLVQLIDQLTSLSTVLHRTSLSTSTTLPTTDNPGLPGYSELVSRYNLILGHYLGTSVLLDDRRSDGAKVGVERRRTRWEGATVVPSVAIEESKDWIVGMLLRTKQTPEVEAHHAHLQADLPPSFRSSSAAYAEAVQLHSKRMRSAYETVRALSEREDRNWKERVTEIEEDDDDEDDDEAEEQGTTKMVLDPLPAASDVAVTRKWSLQDLANYERTGIIPAIISI